MENSGKIERSAGILMHISSLPSPFGIGTFGKTAYEFVDFVAQARHRYWQDQLHTETAHISHILLLQEIHILWILRC
jgi:4-alpha-glucanotransferase